MQSKPEITFQNIDRSEFIEKDILKKTDLLTRHHPEILGCHIVVSAPHKGMHKGQIYEVHINIKVPGNDISVTREPGINHAHEDVYVAIRDSFSKAKRLLSNRAGKAHDRKSKGPSIKDMQ